MSDAMAPPPPKEKPGTSKWGLPEQRDLAMAIIMAQGGEKPKHDWAKVHEYMTAWGHTFTRDAMNQHWSKTILRDFRNRHGTNAVADAPATPGSANGSPAKGRKRAPAKAKGDAVDDEDGSSPVKKRRTPKKAAASPAKAEAEAKSEVKNEEPQTDDTTVEEFLKCEE